MSRRTRVVYTDPGGRGWATVELMARLLADCLDAELVMLSTRPRVDRVRRATGTLPRRRSSGTCIVIAPQPAHLGSLLTPGYLLRGYDRVVGWVIDSFLDDRIPRMASQHFDQLFITDAELVETWRGITNTPTHWLPFGSDVLSQPPAPLERGIDLLRVGRQPVDWQQDDLTAKLSADLGLAFSPGPPILQDSTANQASLMHAMRSAKFTLSFSNLVSPANYTHPTMDYVTGRWTDALASGAAVAGIPPSCIAGRELLWDEGLLRVPAKDRMRGLQIVAEAVADWDPSHAHAIHLRALKTLDWRVRFNELVHVAEIYRGRLDDELERRDRRLDQLGGPSA